MLAIILVLASVVGYFKADAGTDGPTTHQLGGRAHGLGPR